MRHLVRAAVVMAFTLPFLASAALVASADEGSSGRQTAAGPRIRPPLGVLHHVDAPTADPVALTSSARELVILVGGYQSCACPDDGGFDALRAGLGTLSGIDIVRFGTDPRYPYDTYGSIDASAISLRDYIRSVGSDYSAVHIVAHSMGGVVADRAFASGLSHEDGVATYVALAAPHNGTFAARGLVLANAVGGGPNPAIRESLLWLKMESESQAVRDLASTRPITPPRGVVRLDVREASDVLVTPRDAYDPGVISRTFDNAAEGHGGLLDDPDAIDLVKRTIAMRAVPPERRSTFAIRAAEDKSEQVGIMVFAAVCVLTAAAFVYATGTSTVFRFPVVRALHELLPRASRKPCP